jgi:hypothetical protein
MCGTGHRREIARAPAQGEVAEDGEGDGFLGVDHIAPAGERLYRHGRQRRSKVCEERAIVHASAAHQRLIGQATGKPAVHREAHSPGRETGERCQEVGSGERWVRCQ